MTNDAQVASGDGPSSALGSWWLVTVQGYRFALNDGDVAGFVEDLAPAPVHHAPAWLVGLARIGEDLMGVVDLGRFLGLCTARPGITVVPRPGACAGWALRVHAVHPQPVQAAPVSVAEPEVEAAAGDTPTQGTALGNRPRPVFCTEQITWESSDGSLEKADVLNLGRWSRHPRLQELSR